jgi:hypothetical protein
VEVKETEESQEEKEKPKEEGNERWFDSFSFIIDSQSETFVLQPLWPSLQSHSHNLPQRSKTNS